MTQEQGDRTRGLPERDAPRPGRATHSPDARDRPKPDPHASPLGRQPPTDAGRDTAPLTGGSSVAGRRGMDATRGSRGLGEELTHENKPTLPRSQGADKVPEPKGNEAARSGEEAV